MSELNAVVAVYGTHTEAEEAVKELQRTGIDMRTLSIVGKDSHADEHVVGYYNTGDRMKYWGKTAAFWGYPRSACLAYDGPSPRVPPRRTRPQTHRLEFPRAFPSAPPVVRNYSMQQSFSQ